MSFDICVLQQKVHNRVVIIQAHTRIMACFAQFYLCDLLVVFASCVCCFCTFSSHSVYHTAFGQMKTLFGQDCKTGY